MNSVTLETAMGTTEEKPAGSTESPLEERLDAPPAEAARQRKAYSPPRILVDGDVRSFVLGGSMGTGDSGSGGFVQKPF